MLRDSQIELHHQKQKIDLMVLHNRSTVWITNETTALRPALNNLHQQST